MEQANHTTAKSQNMTISTKYDSIIQSFHVVSTVPPVEHVNLAISHCIQDSHQMSEHCLPDAKLEFMEKISDNHRKDVKAKLW